MPHQPTPTAVDMPTGNLGGNLGHYFTVQLSPNAPGGEQRIHLGAYVDRDGLGGGLGPIICGLDRHARNDDGERLYGFSCGGGHTTKNAEPCSDCLAVYANKPGGISSSMFGHLFATPDPTGGGATHD